MERRGSVRYDIRLMCRLLNADERESFDGITLDVGRTGALIAIGSCNGRSFPQPGDPVKLELLLPPHHLFGQRCLACEGVAIRVDRRNSERILAVQFEQMMFRPPKPVSEAVSSMAVM